MRRHLPNIFLTFLILLHFAPAADGKLFGGKQKPPPPPAMEPQIEQLIRTVSERPELMDLDYLEPELGRPENELSQSARQERSYHWYDSVSHTPLYELDQTVTPPSKKVFLPGRLSSASGRVTESVFTVFLDQHNVKSNDIKKLFGPEETTTFDDNGKMCKDYRAAPYTTLTFIEPQGTFRVTQARITYHGPPLLPISQYDKETAQDANVKLASQELDSHDWHAAELHLRRHLAQYPQDAAVHFELAQALREESEINDAINEYRTALKFADGNEDLREKCFAGLRELKVED